QLAWKLRNDSRVIVLERTNARHLSGEHIGEAVYFATIDVSFISLRLILPVVETLIQHPGYCLALVKPQFEAGRKNVGKKGVVRDPAIHAAVLEGLVRFISLGTSMRVLGLTHSPIRGPEGNIEFLCYLSNETLETSGSTKIDIDGVVTAAHDGTTFSC
ncbi:MAG: TlyA family RNA methyltransferase, partial [Synergistota bacterium]|nr:TlyA family RNA methyltransferase [Synergistota bacterium]